MEHHINVSFNGCEVWSRSLCGGVRQTGQGHRWRRGDVQPIAGNLSGYDLRLVEACLDKSSGLVL